ncbi:MAG: hypothetical protein IPK80_03855 [Nannocystis sp.]|nr:hypothetical protein [Nannocystis sp.]
MGNIISIVQLDPTLALLVQPDPDPRLSLHLTLNEAGAIGPILLRGGQPGVFYQLHQLRDDAAIGLPAYFHKRDDLDPRSNKGIDLLRVEVDLALARDPSHAHLDARPPAHEPPPLPLIDAAPLPFGAVLRVHARRAVTGLGCELTSRATIDPAPEFLIEPASVAPGGAATVVIPSSRQGERYRLLLGDTLLAEAAGVDGPLALHTGPLAPPALLRLHLTRVDPGALTVERSLAITVPVTPSG